MKNLFRIAFGGGNRLESSLQRGEEAKEVTKLLRHYGTKVVSGIKDDRTLSREDDKFETEIVVFVNSSDEYESIVGWVFQPNNEKSIQPYPSPEFLNSLSFIKKFYPAPLWGEGEFTKVTHEIAAISRHSERIAKESSNTNLIQLQGKKNSLTETNLFTHSPIHLFTLKRTAFTLAEVLITLGIIGVVAAITMPVLLSNVNSKVKAERVLNIKQKLSKVTDKMAVQSGLMGYENTEDFVKEMQKHMKIAKVCDNAHLDNCWPTKEVTLDDEGKTWEISKTKNAKTLKVSKADGDDWSDTVGIVTADGTAMILSYNKGCTFDVDKTGLQGNGAVSNSLNCLAGVFDWNGGKKPNKLAKLEGDSNGDVITLGKASGLCSACSLEVDGKCFSAPFKPTQLTKAECEAEKGKLGIRECCPSCDQYGGDSWAGAVKQCGGVSKMPTMADLGKLATELYKGNPTVGAMQTVRAELDTSKASSLGFTGSRFYVWSGAANDSSSADARYFWESDTGWLNGNYYYRYRSRVQAVCVSE